LRLEKRRGYAAHVCRDGAFRFTADGVQLYREVEFGFAGPAAEAPKRSEVLTLTFTVFAEPKLPVVGVGEPRLSAAYDTDKRSMLLPPGGAEGAVPRIRTSRYGNTGRCFSERFRAQLRRPSATAAGIAVLRGTLPLTLLVEQKPAVLNDLLSAKGKSGKAGTTSFQIEGVEPLPGGRARVIVKANEQRPKDALEHDFTWVDTLSQRIEVQDGKGGAYQLRVKGTSACANGEVRLNLVFAPEAGANVGPPSKFIFHDWTTREHLASFEFKELPLP
jgi:hypothetical protein